MHGASSNNESALEKFLLSLVAGGGAGAVSKTVIAPLERTKILLQVQVMHAPPHGQMYTGIVDTLKGIYRHEGLAAYWKGNYTNCIRIIPTCALKFTLFDSLKLIMLPEGSQYGGVELYLRKVAAGGLSGACTLLCVYPLEVVRTRLTANQAKYVKDAHFKGMSDCFVKTVRYEGAKALYKGLGPSLLGIMPYLGIMFSTNDTLKLVIPKTSNGNHSTLAVLFMGGVSGVIAQTLVFPIDTVRNRMQMDGVLANRQHYRNAFDCFKSIYYKEGVRAFYRGVSTNMYKGFLGVAIEFLMYDHFKHLFFAVAHQTDRAGKL